MQTIPVPSAAPSLRRCARFGPDGGLRSRQVAKDGPNDQRQAAIVVQCAGVSLVKTAGTAADVEFGVRINIAVVTAHPAIQPEASVSDADDAVVRVPRLTPFHVPGPSGQDLRCGVATVLVRAVPFRAVRNGR
jgi:hypothetical protein